MKVQISHNGTEIDPVKNADKIFLAWIKNSVILQSKGIGL
jgi:hypothetical protein